MIHPQDTGPNPVEDTTTVTTSRAAKSDVTAIIPSQPNRDSLDAAQATAQALTLLAEAGFTISGTAEFEQDGVETRVTFSSTHRPLLRRSQLEGGIHGQLRYESHHTVCGMQVPYDEESAVEDAIRLAAAKAVTR